MALILDTSNSNALVIKFIGQPESGSTSTEFVFTFPTIPNDYVFGSDAVPVYINNQIAYWYNWGNTHATEIRQLSGKKATYIKSGNTYILKSLTDAPASVHTITTKKSTITDADTGKVISKPQIVSIGGVSKKLVKVEMTIRDSHGTHLKVLTLKKIPIFRGANLKNGGTARHQDIVGNVHITGLDHNIETLEYMDNWIAPLHHAFTPLENANDYKGGFRFKFLFNYMPSRITHAAGSTINVGSHSTIYGLPDISFRYHSGKWQYKINNIPATAPGFASTYVNGSGGTGTYGVWRDCPRPNSNYDNGRVMGIRYHSGRDYYWFMGIGLSNENIPMVMMYCSFPDQGFEVIPYKFKAMELGPNGETYKCTTYSGGSSSSSYSSTDRTQSSAWASTSCTNLEAW